MRFEHEHDGSSNNDHDRHIDHCCGNYHDRSSSNDNNSRTDNNGRGNDHYRGGEHDHDDKHIVSANPRRGKTGCARAGRRITDDYLVIKKSKLRNFQALRFFASAANVSSVPGIALPVTQLRMLSGRDIFESS